MRMTKEQAQKLANLYDIDTTKDVYELHSSEMHQVLEAADLLKYRQPKHANGSRGRYFFEYLKRTINKKED